MAAKPQGSLVNEVHPFWTALRMSAELDRRGFLKGAVALGLAAGTSTASALAAGGQASDTCCPVTDPADRRGI